MTIDVHKLIQAAKALEEYLALNTLCRKNCLCPECEARGELRFRIMKLEYQVNEKA